MKIVIDIPEGAYELLKNEGVDWLGAEHILNAVANGIPLEEELEKIKNEIQGLIDFEESCCGDTTLGYQCLGVIEDMLNS